MTRTIWEKKISAMIRKSQACEPGHSCQIEGMIIYLNPNVYSPKYFPESSWYSNNLLSIIQGTKAFLEVGLGSGIISLYIARLG